MRATLPRQARLQRPSEYVAALKGKRIAQGALFVISVPRGPAQDGQTARLGLIIAKRFAPRAVTRNAIKRVIREAFRQRRHLLPGRDYVFRLHAKAPQTSLGSLKALVRTEVDKLLDRAMQ